MKKSVLILFTLILWNHSFSQSLSFDSVWKKISLIKDDTSRINKLFSVFDEVSNSDLVLAERLADSIQTSIIKGNLKDREIDYANCRVRLALRREDFVTSIRLTDSIAGLIEQGIINDKLFHANLENTLGLCYMYIKDYERALKRFDKAYQLYNELGNENMAATIIGNKGGVYFGMSNYEKAKENILFNIVNDIKFNNQYSLGNDYAIMADIMNELHKPDSAIYYCNLTMSRVSIADYNVHAGILIAYGKAYLLKKDYKKAKTYLEDALAVAIERGNKLATVDIYLNQSKLFEATGQIPQAYEAYKKYTEWKDSTDLVDKRNKVALNDMFKEKKIREAEALVEKNKLEADVKRQKLIRNGTLAGLAVVLLFAGIFFTQRNKIKKGKKRSDELLLNILPEEVAEELKAKGSADAKQFDDVTVMFTDFKGFTQISEKLSPTELVNEIHTCFKAFDNIIGKHNIEKIKTIGDAYMCAGGLPVANTTNATDVVNAAMEIQLFMHEHLQQRKSEGKEPFEIRIGIHTGPVVAGIVGVKKFAYDIWGDTVNIASRMESSGEAGKVNISGSTYELVKDKFACTHRGKIQAKNKGEIDMYFAEGLS
jgi:class 3 adenylate cyclase